MKKLHIDASKPYDVLIENGLFSRMNEYLNSKQLLIVTDTNVMSIYEKALRNMLDRTGAEYYIFVIQSGEQSKNSENFIKILEFAAEKKFSRSCCFVSFGGGVCGDLCGFCAATYLRGVGFVQIPTTLLAAVDSSVGGKCAIDLKSGKNLAGCFYQPDIVLCDPLLLKTLNEGIFADGMAEVIKYCFLNKNNLCEHIYDKENLMLEEIIYRCIEIKNTFVTADEFDIGVRQMLNFGHTFAHAYEKISDYEISHGKAVSMGMVSACKLAEKLKLCDNTVREKLVKLLKTYGLPTAADELGYSFDNTQVLSCMLNDKKRFSDTLNLILPHNDGVCRIFSTPAANIKEIIND